PINYMRGMGMQLFNPPDVSGWRQGRPWINAEYLLGRYGFLERITRSHENWGPTDQDIDELQVLNGGALDPSDYQSIMNYCITILIQDDIEVWAPGATAKLMAYMKDVAAEENNVNRRFRRHVRGLLYLLMALPMWQMK